MRKTWVPALAVTLVAVAPMAEPDSPSWHPAGAMAAAVADTGAGAIVNGAFYVPPGVTAENPETYFSSFQVYDPGTETWTVDPAPLPVDPGRLPRKDFAVCADGEGRIHLVGGTEDGGSLLSAAHLVFDPGASVDQKWTEAAETELPDGTRFEGYAAGCAFIDERMYLFGGFGSLNGAVVRAQALTWVWDSATNSWADTGHLMTVPRVQMGYTAAQGLAFAAGGNDVTANAAYWDTLEVYDPLRGWRTVTGRLPRGLNAPGVAVLAGRVMVFGGAMKPSELSDKTHTCRIVNRCAAFTNSGVDLVKARAYAAYASGDEVFVAGGLITFTPSITRTAERLP